PAPSAGLSRKPSAPGANDAPVAASSAACGARATVASRAATARPPCRTCRASGATPRLSPPPGLMSTSAPGAVVWMVTPRARAAPSTSFQYSRLTAVYGVGAVMAPASSGSAQAKCTGARSTDGGVAGASVTRPRRVTSPRAAGRSVASCAWTAPASARAAARVASVMVCLVMVGPSQVVAQDDVQAEAVAPALVVVEHPLFLGALGVLEPDVTRRRLAAAVEEPV